MTLPVAANATTFSFAAVAANSSYNVTVQTQPAGRTCTVTNGSGTITAAVTNVSVSCSPNNYTVGGTISGLTSSGLVLANGANTSSITSGATTFTLPGSVASGASYAVTVPTQPSGLTCSVANGSGTVGSSNVTNVAVSCSGTVTSSNWAWMAGSQSEFVSGSYGSQGSPGAGNSPGGRVEPMTWTDGSGNLWLFGGFGADWGTGFGRLDDVWKFDPGSRQWTWMGGSNTKDINPTYGTKEQTNSSNNPGSRSAPGSWKDSSGNIWMFGGITVSNAYDSKNDLWKYQPATNQWTWMAGTQTTNGGGVCGTKGQLGAGNVPGARKSPATWLDSSGNLWMFGGVGQDCTGGVGHLNDLWKFDMSAKQWAWMGGPNSAGGPGVYGSKGSGSTNNYPSSRQQMAAWTDGAGNFWLFGGYGQDFGPNANQGNCCGYGEFNDLWKYEPGNGQWTWVGGANIGEAWGVYGTQGVAGAGNMPGARNNVQTGMDGSGNVWIFGGFGHDVNGSRELLNDVWRYNPSSNQWTWVAGSTTTRQAAVYGPQGAAGNYTPGARQQFVTWVDGSGHLWVFGGEGLDASGVYGQLNDLWKY